MKTVTIKSCSLCPFFKKGKQIFDCYYPLKGNQEVRTVIKFMPYYDCENETHKKCPLKDEPLILKTENNEN